MNSNSSNMSVQNFPVNWTLFASRDVTVTSWNVLWQQLARLNRRSQSLHLQLVLFYWNTVQMFI